MRVEDRKGLKALPASSGDLREWVAKLELLELELMGVNSCEEADWCPIPFRTLDAWLIDGGFKKCSHINYNIERIELEIGKIDEEVEKGDLDECTLARKRAL
ncbi:hypothetical protein PIB30_042239 [Stylosanthes scabra]|uniref:Uncharacterized protein n=1 Tax=Stylosanthes scabra TaxID=79078 RepID=A0ABU6ZDY5_9FABA|nr:hypothetical protein [Stylosanthes scabra]